jgi:hypothetical protein
MLMTFGQQKRQVHNCSHNLKLQLTEVSSKIRSLFQACGGVWVVQYHISSEASVPRASKEQVEAAAAFINKMKLDSWSVFDISDPGDL